MLPALTVCCEAAGCSSYEHYPDPEGPVQSAAEASSATKRYQSDTTNKYQMYIEDTEKKPTLYSLVLPGYKVVYIDKTKDTLTSSAQMSLNPLL